MLDQCIFDNLYVSRDQARLTVLTHPSGAETVIIFFKIPVKMSGKLKLYLTLIDCCFTQFGIQGLHQ